MAKYKQTRTFSVGEYETDTLTLNEAVLTGLVVTGSVISGSLISFQVSTDGTNFYPLSDYNSAEVTITVSSTPTAYSLSPDMFIAWNFVKARLGTSGSYVLQATYDEDIELVYDSI